MADDTAPSGGFPASLPYKVLNAKHDCYDGRYLRRLKAFYEGGRALLGDWSLMEEVFPRYREESDLVYEKRIRRALYMPYANEILNFIVASMSAEPLEVTLGGGEEGKERPLPEWYAKFSDDCSPPGGKAQSLHDHVKAAILDCLQCQVSWHRVDLPRPGQFQTLADQEKAGALDAYVVQIPAECVIDWDEDESGELNFVVVHTCENRRKSFSDGREMITEVWNIYTRDGWARYEYAHKKTDKIQENQQIPLADEGTHSFGRVNVFRMDVGPGLWAMDNIESAVRSHFNANSARLWALFQSLFQELYEFIEPKDGQIDLSEPEGKAKTQRRGQGFVQTRAKDARAEFVGPDTSSFAEARTTCADLRTEIHRVTHQMALAVDNTGAALQRSAESKGHDKASAIVVFQALGQIARKFAEDLMAMVARGRGETGLKFAAKGMAKFDAISLDSEIDRDVSLESVPIPSATFQRARKLALAKARLGDEATPEVIEAIRKELEEAITQESLEGMGGEREEVDLGGKGEEEEEAKYNETGKPPEEE